MIVLQNLSYVHPNKDVLFSDVHLSVGASEHIALIGNNGTGKSTLLQIIAGELKPTEGYLRVATLPYLIPQVFGQYDQFTIGEALRIDAQLSALHAILGGDTHPDHFEQLRDDWTIEERCSEALQAWGLFGLNPQTRLAALSGGQKTKVFLAGITLHQPQLILMDEPTNHLDLAGREQLYALVRNTKAGLIVVSHDRKLLKQLPRTCELTATGIQTYGGNYEAYLAQKQTEEEALNHDIQSKEKAIRKARDKERETMERQQRLDARGKAKQDKAGVAKIMMNTLRNNAEKSTAHLKSIHADKVDNLREQLQELRDLLPAIDTMQFGLNDAHLHKGKTLFKAEKLSYAYKGKLPLWEPLSIHICSGARVHLKGSNGSGKSTLIRLLLGQQLFSGASLFRAEINRTVYIDQEYSLLNTALSVYEQAQHFNTGALQEHEVKIRLARFLFGKSSWDKPCCTLSGGERMRLLLCCLSISAKVPDLIVLDEPTNNLDIQNVEILTAAIRRYRGTLIIVSHDETFVNACEPDQIIDLDAYANRQTPE